MLLLHALLISFAQLALCGLCGLGAALLLPPPLQRQQLILAPVIGLACLAILGLYGTVAGLTLRQVLPLALILACLSLAAAVWSPRRRRLGHPPARELAPLAAIALLTWLLAVAPALATGRLMPLGYGMDVEFYMGLAAYLKDYSYVTLPQAPAGPIRELLSGDYIGSIAFGAAYAQGMADLLGGWEAWVTWVPLQASLRVLILCALYALLRGTLAVPAPGALAGALLVGLNSLLLWLTYNSFSASLAGLAVLLAALAVTLPTLEQGGRGPLLVGGLLIGGLACIYWPMLTAFGALGSGLGLAALWPGAQRGAVVLRGLSLLAAGALVGLLPNLRAPRAFPGLFAATTAYMGIDFFAPPQVIAGTLRLIHPEPGASSAAALALGWLGLAAIVALLAFGMWRGAGRRLPAAALGACALLYMLGLRLVVGYPYGYFRGASYVAPILLGLAGAGLGALLWPAAARPHARRARLASALGLVAVGASLATAVATTRSYATAPSGYPAASNQLGALAGALDRPGPLLFSSAAATALCGNHQGAWAYWLRDRELLGHVRSTFATSVNPRGGAVPAYGVLLRGEDPVAHGLSEPLLWQDDLVSVYAAPVGVLSWLSGLDRYSVPPACAGASSNAFRAGLGLGDYAAALPGRPLALYLSPAMLSLAPLEGTAPPAERTLQLTLVSFVAQSLELDLGGKTRRLAVPAGLSRYNSGPLTAPLTVSLRPEAAALLLRSAELAASGPPAGLSPLADVLLLGVAASATDAEVTVDLRVHNQSDQALRLALEIYEERYGYAGAPARYAGGAFALPPAGDHRLELNLQRPAARLDGTPLPLTALALTDGRYFAALWVYQGEQVRRQIPLASFERRDGLVRAVQPLGANAVVTPIGAPAMPLDVVADERIRLVGFELSAPSARPGTPLRVTLLWEALAPLPQSYLVFVQLLGAGDAKAAQWDGAAGGDWLPSAAWIPGQRIWQDVPLLIAADAPPGRYRLVAGLYDPATGARLPLSGGGDMLTLAELELTP